MKKVVWLIAGAGLAGMGLAGCDTALMNPRGPIGAAEKQILIDSLAIMLAIVVPTILGTLGVAWWFRASNTKARYLSDWSFSGRIELVVWSIPLMVVILLGGVTWIGAHQLDPMAPIVSKSASKGASSGASSGAAKVKPLEIQVVSLDWKWLFIYPEHQVAAVNELVVPAGVPLHFSLTSASVMNTFFVPQLGSMIYTMNGMATQLNLQVDEPGTFAGLSAHYSGDGFSDMHFNVRALPSDGFAGWVASTHGTGATLDTARYNELAKQSTKLPPSTFGSVEPDLFGKIVSQQIPAGPGPKTERHGAAELTPASHVDKPARDVGPNPVPTAIPRKP